MSSTQIIPAGVFYLAISSLMAMSEKPTFRVSKITNTCKQIASVTCKKVDIADKKMVRHLTNRLVQYGLENIEVYHV